MDPVHPLEVQKGSFTWNFSEKECCSVKKDGSLSFYGS